MLYVPMIAYTFRGKSREELMKIAKKKGFVCFSYDPRLKHIAIFDREVFGKGIEVEIDGEDGKLYECGEVFNL